MPVYAVVSGKGGVGKTIFTLNAGAALSEMGLKTLIIDCDIAMPNLSQVVNVNSNEEHPLHEVLAGELNIQDAINRTSYGLDVILSSVSIAGFLQADLEKLNEVIAEVVDLYDFILLDTATGICLEALIPFKVCDEVILIVNPEFPSIVDAQKVRLIAETMGKRVKGVVINRVKDIKGELGAKNVGELLGLDVLGVLPEDKNMVGAITSKTPLVIKESNSPAAKNINEVVKKIAKRDEEEKIEEGGDEVESEEEKKSGKKLFGAKRKK